MNIIDRRLNPGGKSLANRQRFLRRARSLIRQAVRESSAKRSIKDMEKGGDVSVPADGIREPGLRRAAQGGDRDYMLPGNRDYVEGDGIARPPQSQGGGGGEGSADGDGEDDFRFALSQQEFLDLYLEDLELPDLAKRRLMGEDAVQWRRAGFSVSGPPASLAVARTMRNSLSRRLALKRPTPEEVAAIAAEMAQLAARGEEDTDRFAALQSELELKTRRMKRIAFIDPVDVRYRRFETTPKPIAQAVMFCLMDVSGSMTEHMKDLAKRFYSLLYIFLKRCYPRVEVVFIRHTHEAAEVDEQTFFHSRETGGTVVSTALEEMMRVVTARFKPSDWNIYAAQASDGDNMPADNERTAALLTASVLPVCQYYAYLEVGPDEDSVPMGFSERASTLWRTYALVKDTPTPLAMRKVRHRRDIYPVFRELFARRAERQEAP